MGDEEGISPNTQNVGRHYYPGCEAEGVADFYTSDCAHGCGCWMGGSRSGGPDGVDPFGDCPKNPESDEAKIDRLGKAVDHWKEEARRWEEGAKHAEAERAKAKQELAFFYSALEDEGNYWAWMDCGDNAIESLCCAVVMDPEHLREFFALLTEARRCFSDYQMDVDVDPPEEHREFMKRLDAAIKKAD